VKRLTIELAKGQLRVAESGLFLDAHRRSGCAFVSHAHRDHIARHERTIATSATVALIRHRLGAKAKEDDVLPAEYRRPFGLGELTLELFPAGHVLGAAQLRVTRNGVALGYTGDLCTEATLTARPAEVVECDVLVLESTFGLPRYVFPPREAVLAEVRRFVDAALAAGAMPVLFGYALGKAQEILKYLGEAGYPCRAHPAVHAVDRIYEAQGVALPNVTALTADGPRPGEVVVAPPHLSRSAAILRIRNRRTAVLTGWAVDGLRRFRAADAAFPLSDHADFPSLVRYAKASGAARVLTVHGYARELAAALRAEGIRAQPLIEREQLELW
jgi:putative mRNA 3-end processing factor